MISITAELLHGTLRANRSEPAAGSSSHSYAEWPPSPARLFAALVAGGGTGDENVVGGQEAELRRIEQAAPPLIAASAQADVQRTRLEERFVVIDASQKGTVQDYPARKAAALRGGDTVAPKSPLITYVWPELQLPDDELATLKRRAARVPYLGGADSPVHLTVNTVHARDQREIWNPSDDGLAPIAVPYPGYLGELDRAHLLFREGLPPRGGTVRRARVLYRAPGDVAEFDGQPTIVWCQFAKAFNYRRVLAVAEALKGAVMSSYSANGFGEAPPELTGHGLERGAHHVRFIPLPNVGHEHSDGRIMGAAVWIPADIDPRLVERIAVATGRVTRVHILGGAESRLELRELNASRPWSTHPKRWTRPSRRFATAFPAVHERFGRLTTANATEMVAGWFRNAGLPEPTTVSVDRTPYFNGLGRLAAREVWRPKSTQQYPFSHLVAEYSEPVGGLLAVGRGRSYGLGLLAPISDAVEEASDGSAPSSENVQ